MTQNHFYQNSCFQPASLEGADAGGSSPGQHQSTLESDIHSFDSDDWQTINFPNTLIVQNLSAPGISASHISTPDKSVQGIAGAGLNPTSKLMNNSVPENSHSLLSSDREIELLTLIRDLNECNDVLLQKVSELEEALDRSQTALQAEIDHSQLGDSLSGHGGADAQSVRPSDRQIAKLVTELELSNQALQRQQLLGETLQTELTMSQEKLTRLEQECAVLQQKHTDQSQALLQTEANCRDLRARLQRQQRYTLQFKAALEKCLNVSAGSQTLTNDFVSVTEIHGAASSVAMPKAQNIQPWASDGPYQKLDPQLESMIRNLNPTEPPLEKLTQLSNPARLQLSPAVKPTDPEAENQLWQDLARVIETPVASTSTLSDFDPDLEAETPFEPSPWGAPLPDSQRQDLLNRAVSAESRPEMSVDVPGPVEKIASTFSQDAYVPAMNMQEGAPSLSVSPLKPQRRIKSLAAVELPSFPRLPKPAQ